MKYLYLCLIRNKHYHPKNSDHVFQKKITDTAKKILNDSLLPDLVTKKSDKGRGFKELHIQIMLIKLWLRGIHHKCSPGYLQSYLNEYAFRFNNRNRRHRIFHRLLSDMMHLEPHPFPRRKMLCALIT